MFSPGTVFNCGATQPGTIPAGRGSTQCNHLQPQQHQGQQLLPRKIWSWSGLINEFSGAGDGRRCTSWPGLVTTKYSEWPDSGNLGHQGQAAGEYVQDGQTLWECGSPGTDWENN